MVVRSRSLRYRAIAVLVATAMLSGCGVRHLPPPDSPPRVVPEIPEVPESPPAEGMGRLLIDTEREPAKVMRVTETTEGTPMGYPRMHSNANNAAMAYPGTMQKTELLCITPCAVDLRTGAHSLVFASTNEPAKTSSADVAVPRGTTVVRHELGREKPLNGGYFGGALLMLFGSGLTVMGGLGLAVGLSADPKYDETGKQTNDPKAFTAFGAVLGTVGLATLVTGIVLMVSNQPMKRPGATTTFRVAQ